MHPFHDGGVEFAVAERDYHPHAKRNPPVHHLRDPVGESRLQRQGQDHIDEKSVHWTLILAWNYLIIFYFQELHIHILKSAVRIFVK